MILILLITCLLFLVYTSRTPRLQPCKYRAPIRRVEDSKNISPFRLHQRKPDWVISDVIRLKAYMPKASCRTIAHTFNRIHRHKRNMTVSKSYVYGVFIKHGHEILHQQKRIKQRPPCPYNKNQLWQIDLTTINGQTIFGIIDCATRKLLFLDSVTDKRSITLLFNLCKLMNKYGKPKAIRSDNEACFTSKLMSIGLRLIGVKKQTTQVASPWQNGRIERLFGTLKQYLNEAIIKQNSTQTVLCEFVFWYNCIRPHQALNGATPDEVWGNKTVNKRGEAYFLSLWGGVLTGFYVPPD